MQPQDPRAALLGTWRTPEDPEAFQDTQSEVVAAFLHFDTANQLTHYLEIPYDPSLYLVHQCPYKMQSGTRRTHVDIDGQPIRFQIDDKGRLILGNDEDRTTIYVRTSDERIPSEPSGTNADRHPLLIDRRQDRKRPKWKGITKADLSDILTSEDLPAEPQDARAALLGTWRAPEDPDAFLDTEWGELAIFLHFDEANQLTTYLEDPYEPGVSPGEQAPYEIKSAMLYTDAYGDGQVRIRIDAKGRLILGEGEDNTMIFVRTNDKRIPLAERRRDNREMGHH